MCVREKKLMQEVMGEDEEKEEQGDQCVCVGHRKEKSQVFSLRFRDHEGVK